MDIAPLNQYEVLSDQIDVPEWSIATLEKPRVDWILEEGHYTVFGDTWFVSYYRIVYDIYLIAAPYQIKETIPSLAELGGHQLYPQDPSVGTLSSRCQNKHPSPHPAPSSFHRPQTSTAQHSPFFASHLLKTPHVSPCTTTNQLERG